MIKKTKLKRTNVQKVAQGLKHLLLTKMRTSGCRQASSANTTLAFWPPKNKQTGQFRKKKRQRRTDDFENHTWMHSYSAYQTVWRSGWCVRGSLSQSDPGTSWRPGIGGWSSSGGTLWETPPCSADQHTAGWRNLLSTGTGRRMDQLPQVR